MNTVTLTTARTRVCSWVNARKITLKTSEEHDMFGVQLGDCKMVFYCEAELEAFPRAESFFESYATLSGMKGEDK